MSPEQRALATALEAAHSVAESLRLSVEDLAPMAPMTPERMATLTRQEHKDVLAFLKSFEQLQDVVSNRLIRALLVEFGDNLSAYNARSAFDRMESLGGLDDAARFMEIHRLRNSLTHEYPMDQPRRARQINDALDAAPVLLAELGRLGEVAADLLREGGAR